MTPRDSHSLGTASTLRRRRHRHTDRSPWSLYLLFRLPGGDTAQDEADDPAPHALKSEEQELISPLAGSRIGSNQGSKPGTLSSICSAAIPSAPPVFRSPAQPQRRGGEQDHQSYQGIYFSAILS